MDIIYNVRYKISVFDTTELFLIEIYNEKTIAFSLETIFPLNTILNTKKKVEDQLL